MKDQSHNKTSPIAFLSWLCFSSKYGRFEFQNHTSNQTFFIPLKNINLNSNIQGIQKDEIFFSPITRMTGSLEPFEVLALWVHIPNGNKEEERISQFPLLPSCTVYFQNGIDLYWRLHKDPRVGLPEANEIEHYLKKIGDWFGVSIDQKLRLPNREAKVTFGKQEYNLKDFDFLLKPELQKESLKEEAIQTEVIQNNSQLESPIPFPLPLPSMERVRSLLRNDDDISKEENPIEIPIPESDNPIERASPQAEDGHIDIANEIAEALARINFYPYELRILWVIWRKTYGWHKKVDRISFTQFEKSTGLHRRHIQRTLKHLEERKIIVASKGYDKIVTYGFQKDYTKWKDVAYKGYDDGKIRFNKQARIATPLPTEATPLPTEATDRSLQRLTQKKLTKEKIYVEGSDELRLATLLLEEIRKNKSDFKQPNLQSWAKEVDLMIRRDGRKPERIQGVIEWCQRNSFWWKNILSTGTLREKFERLEAEVEEKKTSFKTERSQVEYKDFTGAGQR